MDLGVIPLPILVVLYIEVTVYSGESFVKLTGMEIVGWDEV